MYCRQLLASEAQKCCTVVNFWPRRPKSVVLSSTSGLEGSQLSQPGPAIGMIVRCQTPVCSCGIVKCGPGVGWLGVAWVGGARRLVEPTGVVLSSTSGIGGPKVLYCRQLPSLGGPKVLYCRQLLASRAQKCCTVVNFWPRGPKSVRPGALPDWRVKPKIHLVLSSFSYIHLFHSVGFNFG